MSETKPRETETTAPSTRDGTPPSAPAQPDKTAKQDAPFIWPRDLNATTNTDPAWGSDPEGLRDA